MSIINKTILMGRIASELKLFKAKDKPAVSFNIAINDFYKVENNWIKNSQFIPVVAFGEKQSNYITNRFKKGNLIAIEGKIFYLRTKTKSSFNVVVEQITLLSKQSSKTKLNIPNSKEFEETINIETQLENMDFGLDKTLEVESASDLTDGSDNPWELDV